MIIPNIIKNPHPHRIKNCVCYVFTRETLFSQQLLGAERKEKVALTLACYLEDNL